MVAIPISAIQAYFRMLLLSAATGMQLLVGTDKNHIYFPEYDLVLRK